MGSENKELRQAVAQLVAAGLSDIEIGLRLGKSRQRIWHLRVKQMGLERPEKIQRSGGIEYGYRQDPI